MERNIEITQSVSIVCTAIIKGDAYNTKQVIDLCELDGMETLEEFQDTCTTFNCTLDFGTDGPVIIPEQVTVDYC